MKTQSSNLVHKINNHLGVLISSLDAMEANIDDHDFLKEMINEIIKDKDACQQTLNEIKEKLTGLKI
jgi:predicted component of type VI protein secretion system